MSDSVQPHRWQPTGLPWDSPGKNPGVGCHFLLQCVKVKSESEVAQLCLSLSDHMDCRPTRLLHPWDFPGKSTGVGCHCLLRWMWELDYKESWVLKNWCFWTVVLEKTLESPLDSKETHQSILKEISPEYSLEGLVLKLKLQYFGHLMRRTDSFETRCWERLRAGGEGDDRGQDGWMASPTWWTWVWITSGSWWWTARPGML